MSEVSAHRDHNGDRLSRHQVVAVWCVCLVAAMTGLSFAAVPLYDMFCRVTGFGGTTQRADANTNVPLNKTMVIRFDANTSRGIDWRFKPVTSTTDVRIGETSTAYYVAENTGATAVTGVASFNVSPSAAGAYFNKIECFCFQEQTLQPGQRIDMPVMFYVDPEILKDRDSRNIREITLSYTFHPTEKSAGLMTEGKVVR